MAFAQSHPSWWNYASPAATAIVGIDWQIVRDSPFSDPIEAELWGDLGFPELPFLHAARQFVISSPDFLALVSGSFSSAPIQEQALRKGFKPMTYRGIDMWFAPAKGVLSLAKVSDQLLMIGEPKMLEMAIDRGLSDAKTHSPLLPRGAKYAQKDLWVVASQLPDDLANRFVPLDTEAQSFEGSLSVRNGLEIDASLTAGSEQQAEASAAKLRQAIPMLPAIARALQVVVENTSLQLTLTATREQVVAALKGPEPAAFPQETIKVETPWKVERVAVEQVDVPIQKPAEKAAAQLPEKLVEKAPEKPQIIRIVGLDDGPREIVLPAVKPEKPN